MIRRAVLTVLAAVATVTLAGAAGGAPRPGREAGALREYSRRWLERQGQAPLRSDPALDAAARDNAEAVAEVPGPPPSRGAAGYLRRLLARRGIHAARVEAIAFRYPAGALPADRIARFLSARVAGRGFTHLGFGVAAAAPGERVATLVAVRRLVTGLAVKASARRARICGAAPRQARPRVLLTLPDGQVREPRLVRAGRRFCARVRLRGQGRYTAEVVVAGPHGPEVAAMLPFSAGGRPANDLPVERIFPPAPADEGATAARLRALVDRARREAGLPALLPSRELDAVAQAHTEDMVRAGYFGHRSPTRGDLAARLAAAGVFVLRASENLVVAGGPEEAHATLMESPVHRRNVLDPRATHLGIGLARGRGRQALVVTEVFATLP